MKSSFTYKFTITASYEMVAAEEYIGKNLSNEDASNKLANDIRNAIIKVCKTPKINHNCRYYGIDDDNVRYIKVSNYNLFYYVDDEKKEIVFLRFLYSRMNISKSDIL